MALTQTDIFVDVETLLSDPDNVRWPLPVLNTHLNSSLIYIAINKPSALATRVYLALVAGARQTLPETMVAMVRVDRNVGASPGYVPGAAVTAVDRLTLDTTMPGWADPAIAPADPLVKHVVIEEEEPRDYFVYPPNDGNGLIEALVTPFPAPLADDAPDWDTPIPIPDVYKNVLTHLVCHYAYVQDLAQPGAAEKASYHLNTARSSMGLKQMSERLRTPRAAYNGEAPQQ